MYLSTNLCSVMEDTAYSRRKRATRMEAKRAGFSTDEDSDASEGSSLEIVSLVEEKSKVVKKPRLAPELSAVHDSAGSSAAEPPSARRAQTPAHSSHRAAAGASTVPPLTVEERKILKSKKKVVVRGIPVVQQDVKNLLNIRRYVDDVALNAFFARINARKAGKCAAERAFAVSTFLLPTFSSSGYERVANWFTKQTRKDGELQEISNFGLLLFPELINSNHWVLFIVHSKKKRIMVYDPLPSGSKDVIAEHALNLRKFLLEEEKAVKELPATAGRATKSVFEDIMEWELEFCTGYPVQEGIVECGIYIMWVGQCTERGIEPAFGKKDMYVLRRRVAAIIRGVDTATGGNGR